MDFVIRPLREDECRQYREIRLEGLLAHPEAFSAAFEQEAAQPDEFFQQRLAANTIFGGFGGEALLGVASFMAEPGLKRAHKGHLRGMYVRPAARGTGLARQLVEAVLEYAQRRVELVQLSVIANNVAAHRLYVSLGFTQYGLEARALKVDGNCLDEIHMVRMLV